MELTAIDITLMDKEMSVSLTTRENDLSFYVSRTQDEFKRFFEFLQSAFPEYIIAAPPMFSVDRSFVEFQTRLFLDRMFEVEPIRHSKSLRLFLTSKSLFLPHESEIPPPATSSSSGNLFQNLFSNNSATKDIDVHMQMAWETSNLALNKLRGIMDKLSKVARCQKDLVVACDNVLQKIDLFIEYKSGKMGPNFDYFKIYFQNSRDIEWRQMIHFAGPVTDYFSTSHKAFLNVTHVLQHRHRLLLEYDNACKTTEKSLSQMEKTKMSNTIAHSKVDALLESHKKVKEKEDQHREIFKAADAIVRDQFKEYSEKSMQEMDQYLIFFAQTQLQTHRNLLKSLEAIQIHL